MAKRGKRAGATSLEGGRTNLIHLKHSDDGILWEQTLEPVVKEKAKKEPKVKAAPKPKAKAKDKKEPKPSPSHKELSELRKKASSKELKDIDGLIAKIGEPMTKAQICVLSEKDGHGSKYLAKKNWKTIEAKLLKNSKGLFTKFGI